MADYEKRGKNSWRLTVSFGTGANNKKNRERKNVKIEDPAILKSEKKIQQFLDEEWLKFKMEVESGNYISPNAMKFSKFITEWKENYASNPKNLSPTTYKCYMTHIESRLIPTFGHMQIDKITTLMILKFLKSLELPGARIRPKNKKLTEKQEKKLLEPLDVGTIGYITRVLKNIFTRAVEWKLIKDNPMEDIKKPSDNNSKEKKLKKKDNPQYYDEAEAQKVVDALYEESRKWRLLILGSMFGGFRRGELVGLEWHNVNFVDSTLYVENNIPLTENGEAVEKEPKSEDSDRSVDMPSWYMNEMKIYLQEWEEHKEILGDEWKGGNRKFVFHNGTGKPYYYQHPSKWWKRFCLRKNIRYIAFHGLRHSMGTLLLEDESEGNIDSILMAIQRRMGHSRLSTTADIYVHVTKKVKLRTAGKFDKFGR